MKTNIQIISAVMLIAAPAPLALAQNAEEIVNKFESQKIEALEAYITANPDATDKPDAIEFLIESHTQLGNSENVGGLLEQRMSSLPKGADLNPQAYFTTLQALVESYKATGSTAKAKAAVTQAKKDIAGHEQAERFAQFIDQIGGSLAQPGVGDTMDIAFTSLQGNEVDLAKMKGKVVLVDFWATWCGPCVGELPNVQKTYKKFHDKGFEIVAISLDQKKEDLENFIKEKNMPWPQAFDGKGWGAALAQKFGIQSIPATFLVGKDGKVIATNLRGGDLGKAVAKQLGI